MASEPPTKPRGHHRASKSISEIVDPQNEQSIKKVKDAFNQVIDLVNASVLEDLLGFSDAIAELIDENLGQLDDLVELKTENPQEDIAVCALSRLSIRDYPRLGVNDPMKGPASKSIDEFILNIKRNVNNADAIHKYHDIQKFWDDRVGDTLSQMILLDGQTNTTSEAACTVLINEMVILTMKFISGPSLVLLSFPQLNLSSRSTNPTEIITHSQSSMEVDSAYSGPQTRARVKAANVKVTVKTPDGKTLIRRTVLTGSVDYGLFAVSRGLQEVLISGSNNIRNIFQTILKFENKTAASDFGALGGNIDNFVLIEAKRRALGGQLTAYLPQVIGESLVAMQEGGRRTTEDGFECCLLQKYNIGLEKDADNNKNVKAFMNKVFMTLVYLVLESSVNLLNAIRV